MPQQAQVTSVEALDLFRSQLIVFTEKARIAADDVMDDYNRTRQWLEHDRLEFWQAQIRRRAKDLETAQQELFSARLSNLQDSTSTQQQTVNRCKRALDEAVGKVALVKKWTVRYENEAAPLAKQVDMLRSYLTHDLRDGAATLGLLTASLHSYLERGQPQPPAAAEPAKAEGGAS
jgi:hypothetical protein